MENAESRSYTMSRIRSKNTAPELSLRKALFHLGFRYKLHDKKLPGKPDLAFPRYKTAVFVHGCFWHLHQNCRDGRLPRTNLEYWEPKLKKNVNRDSLHCDLLIKGGWKVVIVWECDLKKHFDRSVLTVISAFKSKTPAERTV